MTGAIVTRTRTHAFPLVVGDIPISVSTPGSWPIACRAGGKVVTGAHTIVVEDVEAVAAGDPAAPAGPHDGVVL